MKHLVFAHEKDGVRCGLFQERSLLPVSAACVVANGMRERLTALCGASVDLRLWPPAIPSRSAWEEILRDARLFVVRGALCDAAIVLRPRDAQALAALLFGEPAPKERTDDAVSRLEREIMRRAAAEIASALAAVCGEATLDASRERIDDFVTYFELHATEPARVCIGIALSREPAPSRAAAVRAEHLRRAAVAACVEVELAPARAETIAGLRPGDVLAAASARAVLRVNGCAYARGTCGVRAGRYAFFLGSMDAAE